MLDLLVIVVGFAAGVLAIVALNGARRGGPVPVVAPKAERHRPAPAPAPAPAGGYGAPAPHPPAGPDHGHQPPAYGHQAPSPGLEEHGIRVNLPGAAPAPAGPPPVLAEPPPSAPAPPPVAPEAPAPAPALDGATVVAGGPSLAKPGAAPSPAGARLELADGGGVDLGEQPVTLGRGSDQDLRVRDTKASRAHAVVRRRSKGRDGWEVADQGSANGTYLNGHRIPEGRVAPLRDGDRIGIGDTDVTYVEPDRPATPPPPSAPPAPPAPVIDPDATQVQQ